MNQDIKELTPATKDEDPIEIGTRGYTRGAKFYLGLTYKRVKGKTQSARYSQIDLSSLYPDRALGLRDGRK